MSAPSATHSHSRRALLRDVLIQLTRNALAHSLETPEALKHL